MVPPVRIRVLRDAPPSPSGQYVLYWMISFRRLSWNFALDRALEWTRELRRPLLIFEPLRADYPWACDRFHRFVFDGMAGKVSALRHCTSVTYFPYVEPAAGRAKGLLAALAVGACVVVTDDFPGFFLSRMISAAANRIAPVRVEAVDSNGLLPLRAASEAFSSAHSFRRFLQKNLSPHLSAFPQPRPLAGLRLPVAHPPAPEILRRWPPATLADFRDPSFLASLPISHSVVAAPLAGGEKSARSMLSGFLAKRLTCYSVDRNHPDAVATSGLSPALHFGHISAHEIFSALADREKWSDRKLSLRPSGSRYGWWGMSAPAEEFLDQFVTWRELGFNFSAFRPDFDRYESLPPWALQTLEKHARDERQWTYSLEGFASASTHDPLWNAAQQQLLREGRIHNYLRMLWGKKILEWTRSPREALDILIELNNRYALDGRDPNSYSGIFWCLGRYDRPWGPERPIFGTVRYMSSTNAARKLRLKNFVQEFGPSSIES